jgi:hypothetical protein
MLVGELLGHPDLQLDDKDTVKVLGTVLRSFVVGILACNNNNKRRNETAPVRQISVRSRPLARFGHVKGS